MGAEQLSGALFIDTNVLVYANVNEAPLHDAAFGAIVKARENGRPLWVSRQVLREYLVTLTRPQAFQGVARSTVLEQVHLFREHFEVADDTEAVTRQLIRLMSEAHVGGKQVHDANIVASMLAYDIPTLLTHNVKDFERFKGQIDIEEI